MQVLCMGMEYKQLGGQEEFDEGRDDCVAERIPPRAAVP